MESTNVFGTAILGGILCGACVKTTDTEKPNIIIFIADDAGWNDSGAYGNQNVRTPNIDRLAKEGMKFTNAFITTSSCSPSRASILTGLYPHNTGAPELHMPLPADKALFAGVLKNAGYYTVASGKWHIGPHRAEFDSIFDMHEPSGAADWIRSLKKRPADRNFFMWFAAGDPHRPYDEAVTENVHKPGDAIVPFYLPDNEYTRKDLSLYYDELARLDRNIGQVLEELDRQELTENTMVIFMSDNGRPFPGCKTRMLDEGLKTPFIVRWPKMVKAGMVSGSMISSIDIAPTLCELAGAIVPDRFQGRSFVPVLKNPASEIRDYIAGEHNWHDYKAHERAIRTKEYLYIRNSYPELNANPPADAVNSITYQEMVRQYHQGVLDKKYSDCFVAPRSAEELYHSVEDTLQLNNLANHPDYQDTLKRMRSLLDQWIADTNDSIPAIPVPDMFDRITGKKLKDIKEYRSRQEMKEDKIFRY